MKKSSKIALSTSLSLLVIAIFVASCVCVYKFDLNVVAYWWSWFGAVWLIDIFVGGYIFYKHNRTDETKTFWLFIMIIFPIIGAIIALVYNYKLSTLYSNPDNDHLRLQNEIFKAKQTIKIYTNSFLTSSDVFKAINFARWKGVKVQLIISLQEKKWRQSFLIYKLQKELENKIELHFTNKKIIESFVIIDDQLVIKTERNFDFGEIYGQKNFVLDNNAHQYLNTWNVDLERSSLYSMERPKLNPFKNVKYKIINIFYPFF